MPNVNGGPPLWTFAGLAAHTFASAGFYVEPLIAPDSVMVLYGPREAGKTQLVFTLIRSIQEETPLLGTWPCRKARVLLIEADMPDLGMQIRAQLIQASAPVQDETARLYIPNRTIDVLTLSLANAQKLTEGFAPEIVVFDSLRKIHRLDEVDPGAPSRIYDRCKALFPGSALVFCHHVKKPPPSYILRGMTYDPQDDPEAYRGTTAWLDDADAALYLHYDPRKKQRTLQVTRGRHVPDDMKYKLLPVRLTEDALWVTPCDPTPVQRLLNWKSEHPDMRLADALLWLQHEVPDRSKRTYYYWCEQAGYKG